MIDLPRSNLFKSKIDSQESLLLGHAADITPWDEESAKTGKQCMNLGPDFLSMKSGIPNIGYFSVQG